MEEYCLECLLGLGSLDRKPAERCLLLKHQANPMLALQIWAILWVRLEQIAVYTRKKDKYQRNGWGLWMRMTIEATVPASTAAEQRVLMTGS